MRFKGPDHVVSASTDSTLRLWSMTGQGATQASEAVFDGHLNDKNFVGLATEGDFLACGSETNEVRVREKDETGRTRDCVRSGWLAPKQPARLCRPCPKAGPGVCPLLRRGLACLGLPVCRLLLASELIRISPRSLIGAPLAAAERLSGHALMPTARTRRCLCTIMS